MDGCRDHDRVWCSSRFRSARSFASKIALQEEREAEPIQLTAAQTDASPSVIKTYQRTSAHSKAARAQAVDSADVFDGTGFGRAQRQRTKTKEGIGGFHW